MSQRHVNGTLSNDDREDTNYAEFIFNRDNEKKYHDDWVQQNEYQKTYYVYTKNGDDKDSYRNDSLTDCNLSIPLPISKTKKPKKEKESKFRSPNICVAKNELGGPVNCNCNRHFTLNVPDLRNTNNEVTTIL